MKYATVLTGNQVTRILRSRFVRDHLGGHLSEVTSSLSYHINACVFQLRVLSRRNHRLPTVRLTLRINAIVPRLATRIFCKRPKDPRRIFRIVTTRMCSRVRRSVSAYLVRPFGRRKVVTFPGRPESAGRFFYRSGACGVGPFSIFVTAGVNVPTGVHIVVVGRFWQCSQCKGEEDAFLGGTLSTLRRGRDVLRLCPVSVLCCFFDSSSGGRQSVGAYAGNFSLAGSSDSHFVGLLPGPVHHPGSSGSFHPA